MGRRAEETRSCKALEWLKAGGREGRDAVRSGRVEPGRVESFLGVEPSSFDVESESALSAAGPCVRRETRAARTRGADGTQGKFLFLYFFLSGFIWGVCVCREALSVKVE